MHQRRPAGVMAQLTSTKLGGFFARRLAPYVVFGPLLLGVLLAGLATGTGLPTGPRLAA